MKSPRVQFVYMCVFTAVIAGCSENNTNEGPIYNDTGSPSSAVDSASETVDSELMNSANWFKLDASATFEQDALTGTTITISTFAESGEAPICVDDIDVVNFQILSPPYETIDSWWAVEWDLSSVTCTTASRLPEKLLLGMGQLHEDLAPYLSYYGVTDTSGGAYLSFGEHDDSGNEVVYAYGYLTHTEGSDGTDSSLNSETGDLGEHGLRRDGKWLIHGLFLLELKSSEAGI